MWFSSLCIFYTISHQCLRQLIFCSSIRTYFTMTCINLIEFILYTVKCIWFCMGLYLYLHCFTVFVFALLHCICCLTVVLQQLENWFLATSAAPKGRCPDRIVNLRPTNTIEIQKQIQITYYANTNTKTNTNTNVVLSTCLRYHEDNHIDNYR